MSKSILAKFSDRYSVDPSKMLDTLKNVAFKQRNGHITNEQMIALLVVADQYKLNPFTKEIYAFPDKGSIVPVVGVDGWSRIINSHENFDGMEYSYSDSIVTEPNAKPCPEWVECKMYRKDRSHAVVAREYLDEVYRPPMNGRNGPWQTHTKRMLRHKATIQCARLAFGFVGIYEEDEAQRIIESEAKDITPTKPTERDIQRFQSLIREKNGVGLVLLQKELPERVFDGLYHTFPPGQKMSGKAEANEVLQAGYEYFIDVVNQIEEHAQSQDLTGLLEIKQEATEEELALIYSRLKPEVKDIFEGIEV